MGLSSRRFLIAADDAIFRISNKRFERMMRHPGVELLPMFADQRIRCADLIIQLIDRVPSSVCRQTFSIFEFNHLGCLNIDRFDNQQLALVDAMLAPMLSGEKAETNIVDASQRFVAQGGTWTPFLAMRGQLEKLALGLINRPKL